MLSYINLKSIFLALKVMLFSIKNKLLLPLVFIVICFVFIGFISLKELKLIQKRVKSLNNQFLPANKIVSNIDNYLINNKFNFDQLLSGKPNLKNPYWLYVPEFLKAYNQKLIVKIHEIRRIYAHPEVEKLERLCWNFEKLNSEYILVGKEISSYLNHKKSDLQSARLNCIRLEKELLRISQEIGLNLERIVNQLSETIEASGEKISYLTFMFFIILFIAIFLLMFLIIVNLRPLEALTASVKEIAAGNYNTKLTIKTKSEISLLSAEFNSMIDSLIKRDLEINEKQLQLTESYKKLLISERLATVGLMISKITHEIKNPLNSLSLNVELLLDELRELNPSKSSESFSLVNSISSEIDRLNKIAEGYLNVFHSPNIKEGFTVLDIRQTLEEIKTFLKKELLEKRISLQIMIGEEDCKVYANTVSIKQAFLNLIKNSIESIDSQEGFIKISVKKDTDYLELEFADNGSGIDISLVDKIFKPFISSKKTGTGLGLAITKQIIEDHGGKINCLSEQGKGTKMIIELPFYSIN